MKKLMTPMNYLFIGSLITALLLITSCKKEIREDSRTGSPVTGNSKTQSKKVYVSNLEELYAAVNNIENAGADVIIAPGTYVLSATYPNGGRLELQTDMSLQGQPGQTDAVLIDQSSLPGTSFRLSPTVSTAGIRMGRGANSLEWLSIKGSSFAANALSAVESDLSSAETTVTISHVYVDCNGSRIGVLLRNRLQEHANRVINAYLDHNEIANAVNAPGFGIALQNRISGAQIKLDMQNNYIHGCRVGILQFNSPLTTAIENCLVDLTSHDDRIEGNGCGIDVSGGSGGGALSANNNTVTVKMYGSTIKNNNPAGQPQLLPTNGAHPGGFDAAGGWGSNNASANSLTLKCWGCDISNNNGTDIHAYGAFSPTAFVAGTNNLFELFLFGISANATVDAIASVPFEPAGTNVVNVFR